jgi:hypothetical protein
MQGSSGKSERHEILLTPDKPESSDYRTLDRNHVLRPFPSPERAGKALEALQVHIFFFQGARNHESGRRQICFDCTSRVQAIHRPSGETLGWNRLPESRVNCRGAPPARGTAKSCTPSRASAL